MSRSYRAPYGTWVCYRSSRWDKQQANRGVRRRINQWIHNNVKSDDEFDLVPHFRECYHNDEYGWNRDGHQRYHVANARNWSDHMLCLQGFNGYERYESFKVWPPAWSVEITRK